MWAEGRGLRFGTRQSRAEPGSAPQVSSLSMVRQQKSGPPSSRENWATAPTSKGLLRRQHEVFKLRPQTQFPPIPETATPLYGGARRVSRPPSEVHPAPHTWRAATRDRPLQRHPPAGTRAQPPAQKVRLQTCAPGPVTQGVVLRRSRERVCTCARARGKHKRHKFKLHSGTDNLQIL